MKLSDMSLSLESNKLPAKVTEPIVIEQGVPMPAGRQGGFMYQLRLAFLEMKPGDSFVWHRDNKHCYVVAKMMDIKIRTMKVSGEGYRIWRVS